jgi:hypothetical protein
MSSRLLMLGFATFVVFDFPCVTGFRVAGFSLSNNVRGTGCAGRLREGGKDGIGFSVFGGVRDSICFV